MEGLLAKINREAQPIEVGGMTMSALAEMMYMAASNRPRHSEIIFGLQHLKQMTKWQIQVLLNHYQVMTTLDGAEYIDSLNIK